MELFTIMIFNQSEFSIAEMCSIRNRGSDEFRHVEDLSVVLFQTNIDIMADERQAILLAPEAEGIIEHFEAFDLKDIGCQRYV